MAALTSAASILIALAIGLLAWRLVRTNTARADLPPPPREGDVFAVPVRELRLGASHNSLSPKLAITTVGIRFKVFREQEWRFDEIERVDLFRTVFGAWIAVDGRRGRLVVTVANRDVVRQLLRALPPSVALTARAAALRDDAAS